MKRAAALPPLSREHHQALQFGLTICGFERTRVTFSAENDLLPQRLAARGTEQWINRMHNGHCQSWQITAELEHRTELALLPDFAEPPDAHDRFEERELFPPVEKTLQRV